MPEPRRLDVALGARGYPVWVGQHLLARLPELLALPPRARRVALFTDAAARDALGDALSALTETLTRAGLEVRTRDTGGEANKSVAGAEGAWAWLAANGFTRGDLVVAFGGGVTSDLAGFVAATYHRGLAWVAVPTTLLGMVDAGIGGKTGVNLPQGKNLVGAFHQPLAVISDVTSLETLPDAALATGMAEVIKHGLIARPDLLDMIDKQRLGIAARDPMVLSTLVAEAASVKVDIVSGDETEQGARMFLNYGHTLGHALEALGRYERWTHGEAVALGLMFAANLAARLGYADLVEVHARALRGYGLPTAGASFELQQVREAMRGDKKFEAVQRFVLLEDLGKPIVVADVPDEAVAAAYEAVR